MELEGVYKTDHTHVIFIVNSWIWDVQISRGSSYSFAANVSVEGCTTSNLWGQFCNKSIETLACSPVNVNYSSTNVSPADFYDGSKYLVSCRNSIEDSCLGDNETKFYSLEIIGVVEQLIISTTNIEQSKTDNKAGKVVLICYARYGAIAQTTMHDFSGDISNGSLVVPLPKIGRWYITITHVITSKGFDAVQKNVAKVCFSLVWQVVECPFGKSGFNCTSELYSLQVIFISLIISMQHAILLICEIHPRYMFSL